MAGPRCTSQRGTDTCRRCGRCWSTARPPTLSTRATPTRCTTRAVTATSRSFGCWWLRSCRRRGRRRQLAGGSCSTRATRMDGGRFTSLLGSTTQTRWSICCWRGRTRTCRTWTGGRRRTRARATAATSACSYSSSTGATSAASPVGAKRRSTSRAEKAKPSWRRSLWSVLRSKNVSRRCLRSRIAKGTARMTSRWCSPFCTMKLKAILSATPRMVPRGRRRRSRRVL
mmetsp:Transcript_55042/g.128767  ORF Transcript_55042/g.128767 Transcript_55042/m.128767 type:complete len:228 (-) Transcript_55042:24-707(-)